MTANMLRNWIKKLGEKLRSGDTRRSRRQRSGAAHRRPTIKPTLEALEARLTPSNNYIVTDGGNGAGTASDITLRYAVANAGTGGTITFSNSLMNTTISLSGSSLTIGSGETITGLGAGNLAISGSNAIRVFAISSGQTVSISSLTIENGKVTGSGGGLTNSGTLTLTNVNFTGNSASSAGGGLENAGTTTVNNATFTTNISADYGGGLSSKSGKLTVNNSTIYSNTGAGSSGGGIENFNGSLTLNNSTVYGNHALTGGGVSLYQGSMTLSNDTISGNLATVGDGGGIYIYSGTSATLLNTIVAGNNAVGGDPDIFGTIAVGNYDLIGNTTGWSITNQTGNHTGVSASLAASLASNGGPTQTLALLPSSVAINNAGSSSLSTDQRGFSRPGVPNDDIGAFQLEEVTSSTAGLSTSSTAMTIAGSAFDTNATNDIVAFSNGVTGTVTGATSTVLTVSLSGLGSLAMGTQLMANVTVDTVSSGSPVQVATVATANPTVNVNTANLPTNVPTLTITGSGFDTNAANDSVTFSNGVTGTVASATSFSLAVSVTGLGSAVGHALLAVVTADGLSSGAAVQVATVTAVTPTVTASNAILAATATSMTIAGSQFDTIPGNDFVSFSNGVTGSVTAATSTSLTVSLSGLSSVAAGTALTAVVTSDGDTSGSAVQVATVAPVVTATTTNIFDNGTSVTITGADFSTTTSLDTVTFSSGVVGSVSAATATQLTVTISTPPTSLGSLTAVVTTNGASSGAAVQVATEVSGAWVVTDSGGGAGTLTDVTLPYAVSHALNGDSIGFAAGLTGATITLTSKLTVSHSITITGLGAANLAISGNNSVEVFSISSGNTVSISSLTVENGKVASGNGGGLTNSGTLTLSNVNFTGNSATAGSGGGLENSTGGTLMLSNATFTNNYAEVCGGGMSTKTKAAVSNSTFSNNTALGSSGGGVQNYSGTLTLNNSTLTNNHGVSGGGLSLYQGSMTLSNDTIAGNTGSGNGGGIFCYGGTTETLLNTIVAGNMATSSDPDIDATIAVADYDLVGNTAGLTMTSQMGNVLTPSFLGLSALGSYGGPTQTMALLPGSPAIDAGSNSAAPTTDQRGEPRPGFGGTVDIGAFESQGFSFAFVAGSNNQSTTVSTAFTNPLAVSVTANNSLEPVNGGQVTFTVNPAVGGASATLSTPNPATISSGQASVTATANATAGSYTVTAAASGAASVNFNLTNTLPAAPTTTSLTDNGPNASVVGSAVSYTVHTTGVPNGSTVYLEDASNSNVQVGSVVVSSGGGSTTISSLSIGTHEIFAVYTGASGYASSQSSQVLQTVNPIEVSTPVINGDFAPVVDLSESGHTVTITTDGNNGFSAGNQVVIAGETGISAGYNGTWTILSASGDTFTYANSALSLPAVSFNSNGYAISANSSSGFIGAQRSMVDSVAYTFNTAVNLTGAVTLGYLAPTTSGPAIPATAAAGVNWTSLGGGTTWVMTFSSAPGNTVIGHSIADGVYTLTLNNADVTAMVGGSTMTTTRAVDTFCRLYGDVLGGTSPQHVNAADAMQFNNAYLLQTGQAGYLASLDYLGNGRVNANDLTPFNDRYLSTWSGFTATI